MNGGDYINIVTRTIGEAYGTQKKELEKAAALI